MFLELTKANSGEKVLINTSCISVIEQDGPVTALYGNNGSYYEVKETYEEIKGMLQGAEVKEDV